jgi:hypothetical protein
MGTRPLDRYFRSGLRHWGLCLLVCAAVLTACVRDSLPPKCQLLERDFAEAKQSWLDARAAASDPSSQGGAIVSSSEEEEIRELRAAFETRQDELFESACVTK